MAQSDNDFRIPATPSQTNNSQQQNSQNAAPSPNDDRQIVHIEGPIGLHNNQILAGIGISLVLAVLFWFIGRMLTDTLVKQFAEVGSAKRAGITLFVFLAISGVFTTFGFLGSFWNTMVFVIPAALLGGLTLFVFFFSLIGALHSRKG